MSEYSFINLTKTKKSPILRVQIKKAQKIIVLTLIILTSLLLLAMIAGMIPLIIEGGAGANGNRALALGVVGGMSVGTIALLFITPAFFIIFQTLEEKINGSPVKEEKEEAK